MVKLYTAYSKLYGKTSIHLNISKKANILRLQEIGDSRELISVESVKVYTTI